MELAGIEMLCSLKKKHSAKLKANGADVKVVQQSLRHSTTRIALDTYTQALGPDKRAAQSKVVEIIRPQGECVFSVYREN